MLELLKMEHIQKSFFGVTVLDDVSLTIGQGEIHALLGENGAGKSTLMNILSGVYSKDSGRVIFEEKELPDGSIAAAEQAGIAFVHQELNIFNDLRVYENLFLGKEYTGFLGKLEKQKMIQETEELLDKMGVNIDATELAGHLDTGKKQLLEIAKALHSKAKLIILDEPTTALNNDEIQHLFELVRNLREKGTSFIFISHKIPEIFALADHYTVLRNARYIASGLISETTPEEVTSYMVGESFSTQDVYEKRKLGDVILKVDHISGNGFRDVSFQVRKGEILGLTGLQGAGCSDVMQAIFGQKKIESGSIAAWGQEYKTGSIHQAMKHYVGMVAANRKENSVIPDMNLVENMYISRHTIDGKNPVIQKKQELGRFLDYKEKLNMKAGDPKNLIISLSGGNQQKVILARWLSTEAELLLLDNPTQGIDVGAKEDIYRLILKLAKQGKTIIINTLEIPEIKKIADRCIVFYHGKVMADLEHSKISEEKVMLYATAAIEEQIKGEKEHG